MQKKEKSTRPPVSPDSRFLHVGPRFNPECPPDGRDPFVAPFTVRHTPAATERDGHAHEFCLASDRVAASSPPDAGGTRPSSRCRQQVGMPTLPNVRSHISPQPSHSSNHGVRVNKI